MRGGDRVRPRQARSALGLRTAWSMNGLSIPVTGIVALKGMALMTII